MRLLSARVREYRIHRDLAVTFDPRFTVIAGPNQSGKSTLAEALHRALFLPVKTGGELLKGMQASPFLAEPEVELSFEAGDQRWTLRKRFAGTRGSVSLLDGCGRGLQGDEAEERLAELVGTSAVARTRGAAERLRERWGHLWVWQGSASGNPLASGTATYDHDRLVERLQAGADLSVTSPLDLAVIEQIQTRWSTVFTTGGAGRAPQVRRGSPLQLARAAVDRAREERDGIEALIRQQAEDAMVLQRAAEDLARIAVELPQQRAQLQALQQRIERSRALEGQIGAQQPQLAAADRELAALVRDRDQLQGEQQRIRELEATQAPAQAALAELRQQPPRLEANRSRILAQLEFQQRGSAQAAAEVGAIEARLRRLRLLEERQRLGRQLDALQRLRTRFRELGRELSELPEVDAAAVERLRQLEAAVQAAGVRAETLATGLEVICADQPLRLDDQPLEPGATRLLSQPAVLQVGDGVQLRLLPSGGAGTVEAARALERSRQALAEALAAFRLPGVEAVAAAERRRSDLLAEQRRLVEQARAEGDDTRLRQRLSVIAMELEPLPPGEVAADGGQAEITRLETDLREARQRRDQAQQAQQALQSELQQAGQALDRQQQAIGAAEQALRQQENQLLEARTRSEALLQRHGSLQALQDAIAALEQRRAALHAALEALGQELAALDPEGLRTHDQRLRQRIQELDQQERQAGEARIRAEERLQGDGSTDLQAELEQKQSALESRQQERDRLEQEAAMLTLLRRLLEEEQSAMGSRYTAPILERIGRYLAEVYPEPPQPSLTYDARGGFHGLQWRRGDEAAFGFEVLSTGAREQFAAALRVAMAEVLAEAYDGCLPLLFDDAFANSDAERQAGVHRMLQRAADQGLQVILLTCAPDRSLAIEPVAQISLGP